MPKSKKRAGKRQTGREEADRNISTNNSRDDGDEGIAMIDDRKKNMAEAATNAGSRSTKEAGQMDRDEPALSLGKQKTAKKEQRGAPRIPLLSFIQAKLNRDKSGHGEVPGEVARPLTMDTSTFSDHDCSHSSSGRESGYYSVENISPGNNKDYAAFSDDTDISVFDAPTVVRQQHRQLWAPSEEPFLPKAQSSPIPQASELYGEKPLWREKAQTAPDVRRPREKLLPDVGETKYITAIFEAPQGGIDSLVDGVLDEFQMWLDKYGLLGIAAEVHWSVPQQKRNRAEESRMKDGIHAALRRNNRKAVEALNGATANSTNPLLRRFLLPESSTQENSRQRIAPLDCFQGVYRRYYNCFLNSQHKQTAPVHEPFWKLTPNSRDPPTPNPEQFLLGKDVTKLAKGSLVAINLIGLKVKPPPPKPKVVKTTITVHLKGRQTVAAYNKKQRETAV